MDTGFQAQKKTSVEVHLHAFGAKAGLEPARISTVDFESTASRKSLIFINNLQRTGGATARFRQQIAPAK